MRRRVRQNRRQFARLYPSIEHDLLEEAEQIKTAFKNAPSYTVSRKKLYYRPSEDVINVSAMRDFENIHGYYSALFHEMIHSTGHKNVLIVKGLSQP